MGQNDASPYRVPFGRRGSLVGLADLEAVGAVVDSGEPLSAGAWRERFERRFRELTGARHALSVTSGTVALELAIRLLDLAPGDEVIATPQTFQATVQPLLDHDVTVRFCDVDPRTLNMDPEVLSSLITERTRAILLVHYGGCPAEMAEIVAQARRRGIVVVEDAAHALGASYRGRSPGALADIGCFSFHSTKNITTLGEGGMITLARDDWAERIERLRGNEVDGVFAPVVPEQEPGLLPWMRFSADVYRRAVVGIRGAGTNATMSEAAAAVGLVQLDRLPEFTERRRRIAARLDAAVSAFPLTRLQRAPEHSTHAYHLYTFFLTAGREVRERFVHDLNRRGVEVQLRYFPLHLTPEWRQRGHGPGECPRAERVWFDEHLNLPCHPDLSDDQVDHLVESVREALAEAHRATVPTSPRLAVR
ncbi:DegT/DnrJ/EryC1/StrS family aminotransferase [Streptomyces durbertensis]|uniref:DegT/DnrJ/EryC1/StrS family aminotransferase n=1 Tax=Streptomyces durbertensis TaxID=2448886 RepID=A0ABR6EBZ5_9ACTN|nr:aminotransferase class V-fold PLP-dependent enzyme [Streptomyces durbertensis]MBB1242009.1 DegT/DnrJ/EryC1/StrS family aminotransferase [Streptomyces durbertensis]